MSTFEINGRKMKIASLVDANKDTNTANYVCVSPVDLKSNPVPPSLTPKQIERAKSISSFQRMKDGYGGSRRRRRTKKSKINKKHRGSRRK